jgi:hypothetical protein
MTNFFLHGKAAFVSSPNATPVVDSSIRLKSYLQTRQKQADGNHWESTGNKAMWLPALKKNLYIPDINHGVCSFLNVLIFGSLSNHNFFKSNYFIIRK